MQSPPSARRTVITGMSVASPLGATLEAFHDALAQGKSGISRWPDERYAASRSRHGGDLSGYDLDNKLLSLRDRLPIAAYRRLQRVLANSPRATAISLLIAAEAFGDAELFAADIAPERIATVVAGHYGNELYKLENWRSFATDPDDSEISLALKEMDTDTPGCIAQVLGITGPGLTNGGACAAGNIALRCALDEIRHHDADAALVVAGVHELTPASYYSLERLGALAVGPLDQDPGQSSRPFAAGRHGFVAATGAAALVVEELGHAQARGARIYAEVLGVGVASSGSRDPTPSEEGIARAIERALVEARVGRAEIDYICAHATATPMGDLAEARAIKRVFGERAAKLKINALKSMLGHQMSASALVELVACVLQMRSGVLYPTINVGRLDPEIEALDLDVCANRGVQFTTDCLMKNAFGFGGVNTASILRRYR